MTKRTSDDVARRVRDDEALERAIMSARRRVIRMHRLLKVPLVVWREGRVVEVDPETVAALGDEDTKDSSPSGC